MNVERLRIISTFVVYERKQHLKVFLDGEVVVQREDAFQIAFIKNQINFRGRLPGGFGLRLLAVTAQTRLNDGLKFFERSLQKFRAPLRRGVGSQVLDELRLRILLCRQSDGHP